MTLKINLMKVIKALMIKEGYTESEIKKQFEDLERKK